MRNADATRVAAVLVLALLATTSVGCGKPNGSDGGTETPADAATGTWTAAGNLANGRTVLAGALLPSGKVLVMGGGDTTHGGLASAELYDPATNTWTAAASMSALRAGHTASTLLSGKVLVTGGISPTSSAPNTNSSTFLASAELYDPGTDQWSAAGSMSTSRVGHTATVLPNGKVLVVGGVPIGMSGVSVSASADLYDPATNTWSAAGSTSVGRSQPTATLLLSGKVLVAGGQDSGGIGLASAELYDPATNTWSAAGSMAHARAQYPATLLSSGKVLAVGGDITSAGTSDAELYDPGTDTWSMAGSLTTIRSAFTATLLPNGQVLAAAGGGPGGDKCAGFIAGQTPLCSAELYDPATNLWTATGSLTDSRGFHYAVRLLTGEVLVAGGDNGDPNLNGGVPTLAELYHP
jgi:hypothetical protein